jgi:hypothetical protein
MHLVIDKSIGCVHLTACMSIGTFERIFALECCAASCIANIAMYASGHFGSSQSRKEAKFSRVDFASVVRGHVYACVLRLCHIVLGYWKTVRLRCDLDVAVDCLGGNGGGTKARVDARCFACTLVFYTVVLDTCKIAIGSVARSACANAERRISDLLVDLEDQTAICIDPEASCCRSESKGCINTRSNMHGEELPKSG